MEMLLQNEDLPIQYISNQYFNAVNYFDCTLKICSYLIKGDDFQSLQFSIDYKILS